MKAFLSVTLAVALSAKIASAVVTVSFDTAGEFSNNFTTSQSPTNLAQQSLAGGLNNSGRVDLSTLTTSDSQVWTYNTAFFGTLPSWSVSTFIEGQYLSALGFISDPAPNAVGSTPANQAGNAALPGVIAITSGDTNNGTIGYLNGNSVGGAISNVNIPPSGWTRWTLDVTFDGGSDYTVTGTVESANSSGTTTGTLGTFTETITNPTLAADSEVYLYFTIGNETTSLDGFSTTAIVPEPSFYPATIGLLAVSVVFFKRRRKKNII